MDMTRPSSGHDQPEDPTKIHHPEEEEHHETGASKMFKRVKARAKKIKNSLTKHGNDPEPDEEDDDESDEQASSAARGGVTDQTESPLHPGETKVPAPEEIPTPGTKVFPVASSDHTKPDDATYGHEAESHSLKMSDMLDMQERRDEPSPPLRVSDLSDREEIRQSLSHPVTMSEREESREAHHEPINTPVSLLSTTEDVTRTFAPDEDEYQRKVNIESPKRVEEDPAGPGGEGSGYLSGVSNYESKVTDLNQKGGEEAGVPEIAESLGRMKVTDDSSDRKSEFEREFESGIVEDSPARVEMGKDIPTRSFEFEQKTESVIVEDSPTGFGGKPGTELREDFPAKSNEYDLKTEPGSGEYTSTGFEGEAGTEEREDFLKKSDEFDREIESGIGQDSPTGLGSGIVTGLGEDFPAKSNEFDQKTESGIRGRFSGDRIGQDSPTGLGEDIPARSNELFDQKVESGVDKYSSTGIDGEAGTELRKDFIAKSDEFDQEIEYGIEKDSHGYGKESEAGLETGLGRDLPTKTQDQFTPETRDEPKPSNTYTEMIGSKLGYSGETTADEKMTPVEEKVKETGMTKLPLSGGGSGVEEEEKGVLAEEKVRVPGEEDKALWGKLKEERQQGEAVADEEKGMVGRITGAVTSWFGGATEEVKPKSPVSVEESSQSLGSTVGTKGFSDSGESRLGETGGGTGVVPVKREL